MLQNRQQNMEPAGALQESSLRDLLLVVFRHKKKVIAFFVIVVGLIVLATYAVPETYESEVRLLVKQGRENLALDPVTRETRVLDIRRTMEEYLQSESVILKSRDSVESVVDDVGPKRILNGSILGDQDASGFMATARRWARGIKSVPGRIARAVGLVEDLSERDAAVLTLTDNLNAEALPKTQILRVTYEAEDPALAEEVLRKMVDAYLAKRPGIYETGGALEFMSKRVGEYRQELEQADIALRNYKNENNIVSLEEQRLSRINRLQDLDTTATDVAARLAASQARVAELEAALEDVPETVVLQQMKGAPNFYTDDARQLVLQLRIQEREVLQQYPEDSRFVRNVRSRLQEAERALEGTEFTRTETTTGVNLTYQDLVLALKRERADLAALQGQHDVLVARMDALESELNELNEAEFQLTSRKRAVELAEANLKEAVAGLQEAESTQQLEEARITSVTQVEEVSKPIKPVSPNKPLNVLLALFLGVFGGIGLAFVADWLDHSLRSEAQVEERLGVPALTSVPHLPKDALKS